MHRRVTRRSRTAPTIAEVIVVGPQHDRFGRTDGRSVGSRWLACAGQKAEHIAGLRLGAFDRGPAADPPAGKRRALGHKLLVDRLLQRRQRSPHTLRHDLVDNLPAHLQDRQGAFFRTIPGPVEFHQGVAGVGGIVAQHHTAHLMLGGIGHLSGQRRILRGLIAIEHAVRVVLLRFLSQHDHGGPLGRQACVVVVVFLGSGDPVAGEDQRQVKRPRSARRQGRKIDAEFQGADARCAVGRRGPDNLGGVARGGPQLRLQRHGKGLHCQPRGGGRQQADGSELLRHPVGRLVDPSRARPAAVALRRRQPLHCRLEPLPYRRIDRRQGLRKWLRLRRRSQGLFGQPKHSRPQSNHQHPDTRRCVRGPAPG